MPGRPVGLQWPPTLAHTISDSQLTPYWRAAAIEHHLRTEYGYTLDLPAEAPADALAEKMKKRGYIAHVDGTVAPFRVRIGHYATYVQAATALENMKAKKITGFVAQE